MHDERIDETSPSGDVHVSVSITTYNHAAYVEQAVESVLAQETTFPFEVIVGDDCSTDGTRDVLRDLQRRHPDRLRLLFPARNLGGGGKVNFARTLEIARGAYIASMDGDDYWTAPHKLQRQVEFLEAHPDCSMCFHDALLVAQDGSAPPKRINGPETPERVELHQIIRHEVRIPACSPLFRRDVLCPLPDWYFSVQIGDVTLYVIAADKGDIAYIDEVMGVYRFHGGGMWNGMPRDSQRYAALLEFYEELDAATQRRHAPLIRGLVTRTRVALAVAHGAEGNAARARQTALRVLCADPLGGEYSRWAMVRVLVHGRE